uniref:Uncharacterized protein n=1 Tax=Arundo donax TaxID=35708 RepID=A0A0A9CU77_ARUDO
MMNSYKCFSIHRITEPCQLKNAVQFVGIICILRKLTSCSLQIILNHIFQLKLAHSPPALQVVEINKIVWLGMRYLCLGLHLLILPKLLLSKHIGKALAA